MAQIPIVAGQVLLPIDSSAASPAIRIGGSLDATAGTGITGTMSSVAVTVAGTSRIAASTTGASVTGTLAVSGALTAASIATTSPMVLVNLTTVQRDALTAATGMIIFNTTDTVVQVYDGSAWVDLAVAP